ncbi:hypothetical protein ABIB62_001510 [Mucilaginibacter sp. UYP25]|uniref:STM3941 family protein n=1 Tax=unclassified Mucilaginibacter TaxID=2617802 RepID=UPI0033950D65
MDQDVNGVVEIGLNKLKITALLIGALLFVAAGIWLVKNPGIFHKSLLLITIVGYTAIVFFGVCALFIANKMFDAGPGFVIDNNGIVDNSSPFSVGFIPWVDVVSLSVIEIGSQKFMVVKVEDAEGYIKRQSNVLGRRAARMNYRMYGSPINISTSTLRISFEDLYEQVNERWKTVSEEIEGQL